MTTRSVEFLYSMFILLLASILPSKAQENRYDSLKAELLLDKGRQSYYSNDYKKSSQYLDSALLYSDSDIDFDQYAMIKELQIFNTIRFRDYGQATQISHKLVKTSHGYKGFDNVVEAKVYLLLAEIKGRSGYLDSGQYFSRQALRIFRLDSANNMPGIAKSYSGLGVANIILTRLDSAAFYMRKSLEMEILIGGEKQINIAKLYNNLAIIYLEIDQPHLSLEHANKALNVNRLLDFPDKFHLSHVYQTLGNIYFEKEEFDNSIKYADSVLMLRRKIFDDDHHKVIEMYVNKGNAYHLLQKLDTALYFFNKAIPNYDGDYKDRGELTSAVLLSIGRVLIDKGDLDLSLEKLKESLRIANEIYGSKSYHIANINFEMARAYQLKGQAEESKKSITKGLLANGHLEITDLEKIEELQLMDFNSPASLIQCLGLLAKNYESRYESTKEIFDLKKSAQINRHGQKLLFDQYIQYRNNRDKISGKKQTEAIHDGTFRTLNKLMETDSENSEMYMDQFVNSLASYKQSVLQNEMNQNKGFVFAELPENIRSKKDLINEKIEKKRTQIIDAQSQGVANDSILHIKSELFDLKKEKEAFNNKYKKDYPSIDETISSVNTFNIKDIQNVLQDNQMVVEYYLSDEQIHILTIEKNKSVLMVTEINNEFLDLISSHQKSIEKRDIEALKQSSFNLWEILIQPLSISDQVTNIFIVPDKVLWNINFELLIEEPIDLNDLKDQPFLLNKYAIGYLYSSNFLLRDDDNNFSNGQVLAFSFGQNSIEKQGGMVDLFRLRDENYDLPGSSAEIKSVSSQIDGQYFYGAEANETNFKRNVSDYSIIHLALHGQINDEDPFNSKLIFYPGNDTINDGALHTFELYNMKLNSDLAVLSACNTGSGNIINGEGIMSLGRAFMNAGVNSLLISRWELSDATTPLIVENFYANLIAGENKYEALRKAKLSYLAQSDQLSSDPVFWAGLYVLGDIDPIQLSKSNTLIYYIIAGFFTLILGFLVIRRNVTR